MSALTEEFCPVSESLLGRLYRASPEGLALLIKSVPSQTRAALAYYCSRRAHLQSIGLAIAGTCSETELYNEAGKAGLDLWARAKAFNAESDTARGTGQTITLPAGQIENS